MKQLTSKQNRALLSELVRTDFKLRYQGSVLGYAWSLLRPLLMFLILYIVFVKFLKLGNDVPHFPIYLLLGIVLWQFFSDMTNQSLASVVGRGDLIRKIRIPRWMIVLSSSVSAVINLCLNLVVVGVFMMVNGADISKTVVFVPLGILQIYLFALGLSLFLSAAYVKYRDVSYIWEVCMQAGFYLTPILYPMTKIASPELQRLLLINPMAQTIQDIRNALVTPVTITIGDAFGNPWARLIPVAITLVTLLIGVLYFRREAPHFAENL